MTVMTPRQELTEVVRRKGFSQINNYLLLTSVVNACSELSGTKIASQNRSDHGGRKRARNHFAAEIAGFFALPAAKKSLAASDFWG